MEPLNTTNAKDIKAFGKPKMKDSIKDNNDDNEFATTGLKGSFSVEAKKNDRDAKSEELSNTAGGSSDKAESQVNSAASKLEQKFNARMDELVMLVEKTGEKIQRLGEALCRIGDQVEHLPERKFGVKKHKNSSTGTNKSETPLN